MILFDGIITAIDHKHNHMTEEACVKKGGKMNKLKKMQQKRM